MRVGLRPSERIRCRYFNKAEPDLFPLEHERLRIEHEPNLSARIFDGQTNDHRLEHLYVLLRQPVYELREVGLVPDQHRALPFRPSQLAHEPRPVTAGGHLAGRLDGPTPILEFRD